MEATPTGLFTVFDETAVVWELCSSGEWKHDVAKQATGSGNTNDRLKMIGRPGEKNKSTKMIAAQSKKNFGKMIAEMIGSEKPEYGRKKGH